jgi:hypothetical protein
MKTLRFLFCLIFIAVMQQIGNAQSVEYGYDNAGNRTYRSIVVQKSNEVDAADTLINEIKQLNFDMLAEAGQVMVYPNPASELIHVVLPNFEQSTGEYWIYSSQGILLEHDILRISDNIVPMAHFTPGVYLLLVKTNEKTEQWKILKK